MRIRVPHGSDHSATSPPDLSGADPSSASTPSGFHNRFLGAVPGTRRWASGWIELDHLEDGTAGFADAPAVTDSRRKAAVDVSY